MLPIQIAGNKMDGYEFGLGFGVLSKDPPFGTEGDFFWPGAAYTYFFISPQNNAIGLLMTQLSDMRKMNIIWEFHGLANQVIQSEK